MCAKVRNVRNIILCSQLNSAELMLTVVHHDYSLGLRGYFTKVNDASEDPFAIS